MNPNDHCLISNLDWVKYNAVLHSCNPFFEIWICKSLSEGKKNTNDLGLAWQNIAETIAFADKRKSIWVIQIQEAL